MASVEDLAISIEVDGMEAAVAAVRYREALRAIRASFVYTDHAVLRSIIDEALGDRNDDAAG